LRRLLDVPRPDAPDDRRRRSSRARAHAARSAGEAACRVPGVDAGVIAYKFLEQDAVSPFAGFRWPVGEWVDAVAADPCRRGIHACRVQDLPFWLGRELWEIELDAAVVVQQRKVVAPRGRLVRRVEGWDAAVRRAFGAAVLARTRTRFGAVAGLAGHAGGLQQPLATGREPPAARSGARRRRRARGRSSSRLRTTHADRT